MHDSFMVGRFSEFEDQMISASCPSEASLEAVLQLQNTTAQLAKLRTPRCPPPCRRHEVSFALHSAACRSVLPCAASCVCALGADAPLSALLRCRSAVSLGIRLSPHFSALPLRRCHRCTAVAIATAADASPPALHIDPLPAPLRSQHACVQR